MCVYNICIIFVIKYTIVYKFEVKISLKLSPIKKNRRSWHRSLKVISPYFSETNNCTLLLLIKS